MTAALFPDPTESARPEPTNGDLPWDSRRYEIQGFEVKVSRADWLVELRDPEKADTFRPYCHRWWLVAGGHDIVRDDLPEGWGLLAKWGGRLRVIHRAALLTPQPMPPAMLATFARAVAKTASQRTTTSR